MLIEKEAQAGSLRSNPLPKSHGASAEEILVRVEQHGFGPLQPEPDDGPSGTECTLNG